MKEKLNETQESSKEELNWLKTEVSREFREFQTLSKDKNVINWIKKVTDKCWNYVIETMWKWAENVDVGQEMQDILKNHEDLWLYISWTLKLPLRNVKFSELSVEQKINYLALHDAFKYRRLKRLQWHKEPINAENIIWNCNINLKAYQDMINARFRNYNFSNFLRLENTLKEDFWLTNIESQQLKKYLLLVKEHPEYLKTLKGEFEAQPQMASSNMWWYIAIGLGTILWIVLWAVWMHYIDNLWEVNPESTIEITRPGIVKVENPESVLKFMVTKGKFGNDPEHPIRWRDEVKMFTINDNDSWWKKWAKEKLNVIQSREIIMDLSWDVLGWFDLDEGCQIDIETNYPSEWKWIAYVQLPEPDIMILNDEAKVVSEELERVHISEFKDTHEKLRQKLRSDAQAWISNDKEFYNKTKEDAKNNLLALFKTLKPYWMEIEDVRIRFFDPKKWEKPEPTVPDFRPEQRTIRFH